MLAQNTSSAQLSSSLFVAIGRYSANRERRYNTPKLANTQRTWADWTPDGRRNLGYTEACYGCFEAAGAPWPTNTLDVACRKHTPQQCACARTVAAEYVCEVCGGTDEILTRNLMCHHFLSFPGGAGDYGEHRSFIIPVVPLAETTDPYWLARAIEGATDITGEALSCEQLLLVFDYLTTWAETYEPLATYWRLAGERIISLIGDQLRAALPEVVR